MRARSRRLTALLVALGLAGATWTAPGSSAEGGTTTPAAAAAANSTTVFYRLPSGWPVANVHYQPRNGPWTAVPGERPEPAACAGWVRRTVPLGDATGLVAVFNDGSGAWDNNGRNYGLGTATSPSPRAWSASATRT